MNFHSIRRNIANWTSSECIQLVLSDDSDWVRDNLASNLNICMKDQIILSNNGDAETRNYLLWNVNVCDEVKDKLSIDSYYCASWISGEVISGGYR